MSSASTVAYRCTWQMPWLLAVVTGRAERGYRL